MTKVSPVAPMEIRRLRGELATPPKKIALENNGHGLLDEDVANLLGVKRNLRLPSAKEYIYLGAPKPKRRKRAPAASIAERSRAEELEESEAVPLRETAAGHAVPGAGLDCDIPEHSVPLPPEMKLGDVLRGWLFSLGCAVDLERLCFNVRGAELLLKPTPHVVIRMVKPRVSMRILPSGTVHFNFAPLELEPAVRTARRVARMVQRCDHPGAKFLAFRQSEFKLSVRFPFPIRVSALAEKWRRHVQYEPDVSEHAMFVLRSPKCTLQVASSGAVSLCAGDLTAVDAHEALRRLYPIFRDFSS